MEVLEREKSEKEALSIGLTWASAPVKDSPQSLREYRFQGECCCRSHSWWGPQRLDPSLSRGQRVPAGGEKGM